MSEPRSSTVQPSGQIVPLDQGILTIRKMLGENAKGIGALLGSYMTPERFCGAIVTLCRLNPTLADHTKCSRPSLLLAVLRIAHWQLSPDPVAGQAFVIPRKGHAVAQLGYKGCLALAYRSPLVAAVRYNVVRDDDHFVWRDGKDFVLEHEPTEDGWPERMQDIRAAWAVIETVRGGKIPRVMYKAEILRHKARGEGAQPAWTTDPAPQSAKTVLGDVCRRGPFEGEAARAFQLDHLGAIGKGQGGDEALEAEFSVFPRENGGKEPKGAAAAFKAAHGDRPASYMAPSAYDSLLAECRRLSVDEASFEAHVVAEYEAPHAIPIADEGKLLAWIQAAAKRKS